MRWLVTVYSDAGVDRRKANWSVFARAKLAHLLNSFKVVGCVRETGKTRRDG